MSLKEFNVNEYLNTYNNLFLFDTSIWCALGNDVTLYLGKYWAEKIDLRTVFKIQIL